MSRSGHWAPDIRTRDRCYPQTAWQYHQSCYTHSRSDFTCEVFLQDKSLCAAQGEQEAAAAAATASEPVRTSWKSYNRAPFEKQSGLEAGILRRGAVLSSHLVAASERGQGGLRLYACKNQVIRRLERESARDRARARVSERDSATERQRRWHRSIETKKRQGVSLRERASYYTSIK